MILEGGLLTPMTPLDPPLKPTIQAHAQVLRKSQLKILLSS